MQELEPGRVARLPVAGKVQIAYTCSIVLQSLDTGLNNLIRKVLAMAKKKSSGDSLHDFMKKNSTPEEMQGVKRIKTMKELEKFLLEHFKPAGVKEVMKSFEKLSEKDRDELLAGLILSQKK
jgi:hypothetical protein